jgi:hypothetical protein
LSIRLSDIRLELKKLALRNVAAWLLLATFITIPYELSVSIIRSYFLHQLEQFSPLFISLDIAISPLLACSVITYAEYYAQHKSACDANIPINNLVTSIKMAALFWSRAVVAIVHVLKKVFLRFVVGSLIGLFIMKLFHLSQVIVLSIFIFPSILGLTELAMIYPIICTQDLSLSQTRLESKLLAQQFRKPIIVLSLITLVPSILVDIALSEFSDQYIISLGFGKLGDILTSTCLGILASTTSILPILAYYVLYKKIGQMKRNFPATRLSLPI